MLQVANGILLKEAGGPGYVIGKLLGKAKATGSGVRNFFRNQYNKEVAGFGQGLQRSAPKPTTTAPTLQPGPGINVAAQPTVIAQGKGWRRINKGTPAPQQQAAGAPATGQTPAGAPSQAAVSAANAQASPSWWDKLKEGAGDYATWGLMAGVPAAAYGYFSGASDYPNTDPTNFGIARALLYGSMAGLGGMGIRALLRNRGAGAAAAGKAPVQAAAQAAGNVPQTAHTPATANPQNPAGVTVSHSKQHISHNTGGNKGVIGHALSYLPKSVTDLIFGSGQQSGEQANTQQQQQPAQANPKAQWN